eukprot:scaffold61143_cov48-Phaeocystis_antarctica.AAC.1
MRKGPAARGPPARRGRRAAGCAESPTCYNFLSRVVPHPPVARVHSPPSSDYRSGSSLAAHRRESTGREVFIAPLAAYRKLQVPSCHPYE